MLLSGQCTAKLMKKKMMQVVLMSCVKKQDPTLQQPSAYVYIYNRIAITLYWVIKTLKKKKN